MQSRQESGGPHGSAGTRNHVPPPERKRGDGLERRPPASLPVGAGIARERETSADDAAPHQRERRTLFQPRMARPLTAPPTRGCALLMTGGGCRRTRSWPFLPVGAARQKRGRYLQLFLPAILSAAGALGSGCGGDGTTPTTPEPSTPAPPLDVPFGFTDLEEGDGAAIKDKWLLAIDYTGWLYDPATPDNRGREFGSTSVEGPFSFRLGFGLLIDGIEQGLVGMRVGGLRRIIVPPDLGFGAQGTSFVPGNATLLVEVELVDGAEVPFEIVDLRAGEGEEATNGRSLSMAYHGWVYDLIAEGNKGNSFDSTTAEAPFTFTLGVGSVIAGWDLGILGMRVGGRRRIVIPHDRAYGAAGRPPQIPAYATLLFDVELLAVN